MIDAAPKRPDALQAPIDTADQPSEAASPNAPAVQGKAFETPTDESMPIPTPKLKGRVKRRGAKRAVASTKLKATKPKAKTKKPRSAGPIAKKTKVVRLGRATKVPEPNAPASEVAKPTTPPKKRRRRPAAKRSAASTAAPASVSSKAPAPKRARRTRRTAVGRPARATRATRQTASGPYAERWARALMQAGIDPVRLAAELVTIARGVEP